MGKKIREQNNSRAQIGATRTIGLFGEWGCGKTTFLRQIEVQLAKDPNVIAVYYDAWRWQSACPPEFALLDEIFRSPRIMRIAWFKKPLALALITFTRSLRISFKGFEIQSDSGKSPHIQHFELSLLAKAYKDLFDYLYRSGHSLLLLIDESDRCERLYFQSILSLLPRYLNDDNCFAVVSLVASNLDAHLFEPLKQSATPQTPPATNDSDKNSDNRYQMDLRDSFLAAQKSFGSRRDDFKMHVLGKFFEELYFLPALTDVNGKSQFFSLMENCLREWSFPIDKFDDNNPHLKDIIHLANNKLGWGGNPRLFTGAMKSIAPLLMQAIETIGTPLKDVKDWPLLLRLALGCFAQLQRHESAWLAAGPEACGSLFSKWMSRLAPDKSATRKVEPLVREDMQQKDMKESLPLQTESLYYDSKVALLMTLVSTNTNEAWRILNTASYEPFVSALDEVCRVYLMSRQHYLVSEPNNTEQAQGLLDQGLAHISLNDFSSAIAAFDEMVGRFGDDKDPALRKLIAKVLVNKGVALGESKRPNEEIAAYDDLIGRFGDDKDPALREQVAKAFFYKGITHNDQGHPDKAIVAYDDLIGRFGDDPTLREQVAKALLNKGVVLGETKRPDEEIATYDDLIGRFGDDKGPALRKLIAKGLFNKGVALGETKRPDEAIAAYDDLIGRFGDDPALREEVAKAFLNKGVALRKTKRSDEAIAAYDDLIGRFGDDKDPTLRSQVAKALVNKGVALGESKRPNEEIAAYDDLIGRFGDDKDPALR
ncbi:MAG: tetratricopeptide repeat protein, partial [Kiritimatiellales bacterium]